MDIRQMRTKSPRNGSPWRALAVAFLSVTLVSRPTTGAALPRSGSTLERNTAATREHSGTRVLEHYARLPVSFIENRGQVGDEIAYYAHGSGYSIAFEKDRVLMSFARKSSSRVGRVGTAGLRSSHTRKRSTGVVLAFKFLGANDGDSIRSRKPSSGVVNYLVGNDPKQWYTDLASYREITYENLWDGIDMVFYGSQGELKYDLVVSPGASPDDIALAHTGASRLAIDSDGDLVIETEAGRLEEAAPVSYQWVNGARREIASHFVLHDGGGGANVVGLDFGPGYDPRRRVLIDPGLDYSTYLGGLEAEYESGAGVAVDAAGDAYVTGETWSHDFSTTPGAFDTTFDGGFGDAFIAKLAPDGSNLAYSTYLGGRNRDSGTDIAIGPGGSAYISGKTDSDDFSTTPGAFDTTFNGGPSDSFVAKLTPDGSDLSYSTLIGGTRYDSALDVAVDTGGSAYVTGFTRSADFPTTRGAFDTTFDGGRYDDGLVTKLTPDGSDLSYSTYLKDADGTDVAVDATGHAYVTGSTRSSDLPTTPGAFDNIFNGGSHDAFVTKLAPDGSDLAYSTYLGGQSYEYGTAVAVDAAGNAYVTGPTESSDFPITRGAFDTTRRQNDAFVAKLAGDGSTLSYSTYVGGRRDDTPYGMDVDAAGNAYVAGETYSPDFPTTWGAFDTAYAPSEYDAFVTKLAPRGSSLSYSTYLGGRRYERALGVAVDAAGDAYVTGGTNSPDFPTTVGGFDTTLSSTDAFVAKITIGCTVSGSDKSNFLNGTARADIICAGGGSDTVLGHGGVDVILLGAGHDIVQAGRGGDVILPKGGNDLVVAGDGDDTVRPSGGGDLILGQAGADTLHAGAGKDRVVGGTGTDGLRGAVGADLIQGRSGQDNLAGGSGPDLLTGNRGRDRLNGGVGFDGCRGGAGRDKNSNCEVRDARAGRVLTIS